MRKKIFGAVLKVFSVMCLKIRKKAKISPSKISHHLQVQWSKWLRTPSHSIFVCLLKNNTQCMSETKTWILKGFLANEFFLLVSNIEATRSSQWIFFKIILLLVWYIAHTWAPKQRWLPANQHRWHHNFVDPWY